MDRTLGLYLDSLLEPLRSDEPAEHEYSLLQRPGLPEDSSFEVYFDTDLVIEHTARPVALAYLLWHLNRAVVDATPGYLLIHAAAVERGGVGIVLPAPEGAGKTTLAARLVQNGMRYITDEVVALHPDNARIMPFPKPLSIEKGSWDVLADLRPELPEPLAAYMGDRWHVNPNSVANGAVADPCWPGLIVTPRYVPGAPTQLRPLSRAKGVIVLAENAFNLEQHRLAGVEILAAAARRSQCYELVMGDLDQASVAFARLVDDRWGVSAPAGGAGSRPSRPVDVQEGVRRSLVPRKRPGLATVALDQEAVVYDADRRMLHALNETATLVWGRCNGDLSVEQIIDDLVAETRSDRAIVTTDVVALMGSLVGSGLLQGRQGARTRRQDLNQRGEGVPDLP